MSTTTVITRSELQDVLGDYKIRLTGDNSTTQLSTQNSSTLAPANPANWPVAHRRVPDYRPIDRTRGMEERPNGSNGFEQGFLVLMFTGVVANATAAKIWGATGGPYFPRLFKYAIGGEW